MVFANAAVSAAQKPRQPLRGRAWFLTEIKVFFLRCRLAAMLHPAAQPAARRFFPVGEKQGGRSGVQGQRSSVPIQPDFISDIPEA